MKLTIIAGARPNFMKIAPVIHSIQKAQKESKDISYRLVHTGQHYDKNMSDTFFEELNIPKPDVNLGVGGGTQAEQTAGIMIEFEKELMQNPTDLVVVVGDVTSTMACSIVAKKLNTKVAHIEAGIRSWDLSMPEEINRMVTDALADYYFTTSEVANTNLRNAGVKPEKIFFVGNVMIDTLLANMDRFVKPSVDDEDKLRALMNEILNNVHGLPIIFPIHPRTAKIFHDLGIHADNLHIVDP